jgi:signal transduction histidine kinase
MLMRSKQELDTSQTRIHNIEMEQKHLREKEMLVKDLHDGIGGILTKISMLAQYATAQNKFDVYDEIMGKILGFAYEGSEEVRSFMNSLESEESAWSDLLAEITEYSRRMFDYNDVTFDVSSSIAPDSSCIGVFRYVNIVRIFREAISNIIKHANAHHVQVSFEVTPSLFRFAVSDDGVGFDTKTVWKRGVANLRSRADLLKADLSIISAPNEGTSIILSMPIENVERQTKCA